MNKLSKVFLTIIVILTIALGIMTYYYFYFREAYFSAANEMVKMATIIEDNNSTVEE